MNGNFVWRDAGSRHSAWAPDGGLMLAMFQIPNKFYEQDGRVTDGCNRTSALTRDASLNHNA